MMLRFFEALAVATLLGCGIAGSQAVWFTPGDKVKNVPKNVRSSHAAYRTHYRTTIIYVGGK